MFTTAEYTRSDGAPYHGAIAAWQRGATGQGVTIGIIDTGIDSDSPEFAGRLSASSQDVAGARGIDNAESDHGTNVAMAAAAARDNTGVLGIAWGATVLAIRADRPGSCATYDPNVKDSGCKFDDPDVATGINRALAAGAKVINLSMGGSTPESVVSQAIAQAASRGAVVVVSAGNDGDSTDPKIDPNNPDPFAIGLRAAGNGNVIIAGSIDGSGNFSAFSNRAGTEAQWFLSARGERICCTYENGVLKITTDPSGQRFTTLYSGTSFSAPQVAGAAALLFQAFPNLTATQVVDLLLRTARDLGSAGVDATYGRGALDITAAFAPQGITSIAGSTVQVPLGQTSLVTSAAMGNALSQAALSTVMLDAYQRAYRLDLTPSLRSAQVAPRLAGALLGNARNISMGGDAMSLAFSVDGSGRVVRLPWTGQLRLSSEDAESARVLAASVVARLSPQMQLSFAMRQGADGLVAQLQGQSRPAFMIATDPLDDFGFSRSGQTSFALRQRVGRWGLTASAERGDALSGAPFAYAEGQISRRSRDGITRFGLALDRQVGTVSAMLGATWLAESRTMLGARLNDAYGAGGANSVFLDSRFGWQPARGWHVGAAWRQGFTSARLTGFVGSGSRITSNGWAIDAVRAGVFAADDTLSLRISQPLRVYSGGLNLELPTAWSYSSLSASGGTQRLNLSPTGREVDVELAWRGTLWGGSGSASLFLRRDPGHYSYAPTDRGAALSWSTDF